MAQERPAYCIGNFAITNEEVMTEYSKQAMPIVQKHGGKVLVSDPNITRLEGEPKSVLVILEFPSMKSAEEFYSSTEYTAVKTMRINATRGGFLLLSEGLPPSTLK